MLDFFSDETDNGKLYINYPMVESIKCTQKLPDEHFYEYKVTRGDCSDLEEWTEICIDSRQKKMANEAKGIWRIQE